MPAATGHLSRAAIDARCLELLGQVGLAAKAERLPRDLTQIEMRKLELARAMAAEPKLLIADEAMAGLSHAEVDEIIALLIRLNARGRDRDHDRAHHAGGDGILPAPGRAGGRAQDRRRAAARTWCAIRKS